MPELPAADSDQKILRNHNMFGHFTKCGLLCLALAGWLSATHTGVAAASPEAQPNHLQLSPLLGLATSLQAETQIADDQSEGAESHSERSARINRNLLVGTIVILTLFVLFRLLLVWQISRNRKKMAQNNLLEGEA
ncbi:MAG: hypothetical protein NTZ16_10865 [Verrucomicrobia bacterium]|nr:hypothetical protein [Verrucomicrobiota bacterium]